MTIDTWTDADLETIRTLVAHESLVAQFERLHEPGQLEAALADPFLEPGLRLMARVDGVPAGFAYAFLLPGPPRPWTMMKVAVIEPYRRRGLGGSLYDALLARLEQRAPDLGERSLSAWEPCPEAERFAAARGFARARHFWKMERARDGVGAPHWPDGVTLRGFDGSDAMLAEWNDVYNASFASHDHHVPSTIEICRAFVGRPEYDRSELQLAYLGSRVAGFYRTDVRIAEVSLLGVAPDFQGRGLGRALLRHAAGRIVARSPRAVTLAVAGSNADALRLYRSEGFAVARTLTVFSRGPA